MSSNLYNLDRIYLFSLASNKQGNHNNRRQTAVSPPLSIHILIAVVYLGSVKHRVKNHHPFHYQLSQPQYILGRYNDHEVLDDYDYDYSEVSTETELRLMIQN